LKKSALKFKYLIGSFVNVKYLLALAGPEFVEKSKTNIANFSSNLSQPDANQ
jgi:hypothetical protein